MRKHPAILVPALCMALAAMAQVPRDFSADVTRPAVWQTSAWRGETLALTARLVDGRRRPFPVPEGASASILWSTNGVDWFQPRPASVTTNGIVTATWTPDMDCGAASYRVFLGVAEDGTNICYGANMLLRMLGSPGAAPSAAPFPVEFEAEAWAWATPGDVSNIVTRAYVEALGISGGGLAEETDPSTGLTNGTAYVRGIAVQPEGDYAASSEVLAVRQTAAAAARDADLVYQLMVGSNVVAEVTNYNSRVRSPSLRLLQLEDGEYKVVWTETNGLFRVADAATNHTDDAIAGEVLRANNTYAPRAWSRTTSGLGSEAPSNTTWVSTPVTVIAGGYEYEKHVTSAGEVWVLCSNGLSLGGDTNAYFRISSGDGQPLFAVEKTDAQLIGVRAGAISVTSSGGANLVTIPLDVVSATAPVCQASDDLAGGQWHDLSESAPAWVSAYSMTGSAGGWTATITTTAPRAFFQFRVLQEGTAVIRNYVQQDLSSGIVVDGTRYYPHASGGTLIWTTTP